MRDKPHIVGFESVSQNFRPEQEHYFLDLGVSMCAYSHFWGDFQPNANTKQRNVLTSCCCTSTVTKC